MSNLRLVGTPLSHFTRKIRILLAEFEVPFEFDRSPGVLAPPGAAYGDHPLQRVPVLFHGPVTLIESDYIARYLVSQFDPADRFSVRSEHVADLNHLAVVNGIMNNEVVLILAKRAGLTQLEDVAYFRKLIGAIDSGLTWLDTNIDLDRDSFDYRDIASICLWQHLIHYRMAADPARYPRLAARVTRFGERPSVAGTTPEASLAEAAEAGWKPA
jgi:glutathione S-transferase